MKSEIQNNDVKPELPFPKLMYSTSTKRVFLMVSPSSGTVVHGDQIGRWSGAWANDSMVDFNGTITLSN